MFMLTVLVVELSLSSKVAADKKNTPCSSVTKLCVPWTDNMLMGVSMVF